MSVKTNDIQNTSVQSLASIDLEKIKQREICAAGEGWMAEVKKIRHYAL